MKRLTIMLPALTLAMAILGTNSLSQANDTIIAKVGSREVKASEIQPYLATLLPAESKALWANKEELTRFVRSILVRQAILEDAATAGWDKKPQTIEALARVQKQYLIESYLVEVAKVPDSYPSDEEVQRAYEAEKDRLKLPQRYELSQIFLSSQTNKEAARKKADELSAQLKKEPGKFATLAKEQSEDTASAAEGGKLGTLPVKNIAPEIRKAISSLSKGQISTPIEDASGYHLIRVDEVKEEGTASLAEVRPELIAALRNQRAALNRDAYVAALLERSPVSVNELAVESLEKKP
ncbi:MAG: peptidylprolyl isomerase [Chthoniobacterales bacterium]|jgi:peptidylprolyl isomerase